LDSLQAELESLSVEKLKPETHEDEAVPGPVKGKKGKTKTKGKKQVRNQ